jgi:O-antigen ligase
MWGQILLMFLVVYDRFRGANGGKRVAAIVAMLAVVVAFQAGVGLWQSALRGTGPEHFAIDARFYRAYGTFEQPNPYAGFLGLVGAIVVGIVIAAGWEWGLDWLHVAGCRLQVTGCGLRSARSRITYHVSRFSAQPLRGTFHVPLYFWLAAPVAVLVSGALAASWSRGGWMGFGAAMLVIVALLPRRGWWGVLLVAVLVVGGMGLYFTGLMPASIADRLTGFLSYTRFEDVRGVGITDVNYAVVERMAHWQAALSMWRARFWLGVGFGGYEAAYPDYRLINWPIALGHAHNYYLNLLAETGVVGLAAYLVLLGSVFGGLFRALRRTSGWEQGLVVGLIGAWTHFLVHNLVDNILVNNVHLHLGVILALSAWVVERGLRFTGHCP